MRQQRVKHVIRFPHDVYAKLTKIAENERRSINSQVIIIIEDFIQQYESAHGPLPSDEETPTP